MLDFGKYSSGSIKCQQFSLHCVLCALSCVFTSIMLIRSHRCRLLYEGFPFLTVTHFLVSNCNTLQYSVFSHVPERNLAPIYTHTHFCCHSNTELSIAPFRVLLIFFKNAISVEFSTTCTYKWYWMLDTLEVSSTRLETLSGVEEGSCREGQRP